jgi:ADP-ribose pyrophosphatase YjhB (NUDIX family)
VQPAEIVHADSTTTVPADHAWAPKDFIVVGASIYHREGDEPLRWGLMRCAKPEYFGKLSSFGGKPEPGESILQTLLREVSQESGDTLKIDPIGISGIFLNPVGQYKGQPNNYAANFAVVARARDKILAIPERVKRETKEVVWRTLDELVAMQAEEFRTGDTRAAAVIAAQQRTQGGIVPFETIHRLVA